MESENLSATNNDESNWGMLAHLSALAGFVIPFGSLVAPLIIWLTKGKESAFVAEQAKEALNFQLSMAIVFIVCFILSFIIIGLFLMGLAVIVDLVFVILATVTASKGRMYRYPYTLRLVK
ncbi:MAG: DUF4870 domain-containing protein [Gallionellaceae bacterium]|nr:DUF4870 domain-containing protein [Gallionellaceae bacterium]MDD5364961.1 DUF4870 domain-containing protein [Gallionellaceae bacterium]